MAVSVLKLCRIELNSVAHHNFQCRLCQIGHLYEPLKRQLRLYDCICPFRTTYIIYIVLCLDHKTCLLQVFGNFLPALKSVHAAIIAPIVVQSTVIVKYVYCIQLIFQTKGVVVDVVCRSDFQCSRSKLSIDVFVKYDRHTSSYQRHYKSFTFEVGISLIFGMNTHGSISENCFRTCGCHGNEIFRTLNHIFKVIELRLLLFEDNLLVA